MVLAVMVLVSTVAMAARHRVPDVGHGDAPSYLTAAYHLAKSNTLSEAAVSDPVPPAIVREPGYAFLLSLLMRLSPRLSEFRPECVTGALPCDAKIYRIASWTNLALLELTGVAVFFVTWVVTQMAFPALVAAAYVLFNFSAGKFWWEIMSDRLGTALVALSLLALAFAWRSRSPLRWIAVGLCAAGLTLTKAAFLFFMLPGAAVLIGWAVLKPNARRTLARTAVILYVTYGAAVGAWVARNHHVSGEFRLTDNRGGIVLSTREVLVHMTPAQYAASFVYWTKGPGVGWAKRMFSPETLADFDFETPHGFFDAGQNDYNRRAAAIAASQNLSWFEACRVVDRQVIGSLLAHLPAYAATTLPVLYRGIWIDDFALVGIGVLIWACVRAWRTRNLLLITVLSTAVFNHGFHALVTLNIPRYQMTALPANAVAIGVAAAALQEWWFSRVRDRASPSPRPARPTGRSAA